MGSPPRVRGKGLGVLSHARRAGITPACAGKRGEGAKTSEQGRDHPRVCGEKQKGAWAEGAVMGSPPRVRGKGSAMRTTRAGTRITPACAGKSCRSHPRRKTPRDHPRVCGEKNDSFSAGGTIAGSPPRVRGKVLRHDLRPARRRITPACAGKRQRTRYSQCSYRDHPRVCGEKLSTTAGIVSL